MTIAGSYHLLGSFPPSTADRFNRKSFKTVASFKGHLSSSAHTGTYMVQCPWCSAWYSDMTSLAQHAEAMGNCLLKYSVDYRNFIKMATAGIIDLKVGDNHEDGTIKYYVPQNVLDEFQPQNPQQVQETGSGLMN